MIRNLIWFLFINIFKKGDIIMMAMFFAQRVVLGKSAFRDLPNGATNIVPNTLEQQVADILIMECGLPELVPERLGGTALSA